MSISEAESLVTGVGVLDRVVSILDVVERESLTASDLARRLQLSVPTTHRLTAAMIAHDLLSRDSAGRLDLGKRFAASRLVAVAHPVLEELSGSTGETCQVWVRRGEHRLCIASSLPSAELRHIVRVGTLIPLSDGGSAGHVLDAFGAPAIEPGWIESVEERAPGLGSVSAPIVVRGEIIAAVCVSGPTARIAPDSPGTRFGARVVGAANMIAQAFKSQH